MTTIYQDVRKALQDQAATAAGYPAENMRSYENAQFKPPAKTPWVELILNPIDDKMFSVGGETKVHRGLFLINVREPYNEGPSASEILADNIRDVFDPVTFVAIVNEKRLNLDYAQRGRGISNPQWYMIPLTIGWRVFSLRT